MRRSTVARVALCVLAFATGIVPTEAPATVQEQRARLPPPAACGDMITGVWKSHGYDTVYGQWTMRTLDIHFVEGSTTLIEGTIGNHGWYGPPEQSQPGRCEGLLRYEVSMDAAGSVVDGRVEFAGRGDWRLDALHCGDLIGYNLDAFTGTIDAELNEFQSVNNDGGTSVNEPTVFRRVACHAADAVDDEPRVSVAPPPFYPPAEAESSGLGCASGGER